MYSKVEIAIACVLIVIGFYIYCRELNKGDSGDFKSMFICMSGYMIVMLGAIILQYPDFLRL